MNEALTWLRQQQQRDPKQPFFLYVAFHEPHEPVASPQTLVWIYYNAINDHRVAMRDGDWKVLARLNLPKKFQTVNTENAAQVKQATLSDFQVFNLSEDIGEHRDLAPSDPDRLALLKERLETHYRQLVDDSHVWAN